MGACEHHGSYLGTIIGKTSMLKIIENSTDSFTDYCVPASKPNFIKCTEPSQIHSQPNDWCMVTTLEKLKVSTPKVVHSASLQVNITISLNRGNISLLTLLILTDQEAHMITFVHSNLLLCEKCIWYV